MDSMGRAVLIMLTAALVFLLPVYYFAEKQDAVIRSYCLEETMQFTDAIRNLGFLSPEMYQEYQKKIAVSGLLYSIRLERYEKVLIEQEDGSYQNGYRYTDVLAAPLEEAYHFAAGDLIRIRLQQKTPTLADRMRSSILGVDVSRMYMNITCGGGIRDETVSLWDPVS